MATKKLQILDSLIDAYTKTETNNALATKADLITSENLFDVNVFDGVAERNLTMTVVENGGLRVTGTPTGNFTGVFKGSLIDMIPGEYQISGGSFSSIYFLVKIVRADNTSEAKYNDTIIFKDDDISRQCAIFARRANVSYDEIIYPVVTKTVAEGVLELEQGFKNKFLRNTDGAVEENNLSLNLISKLSYVTPQMFGALGDGIKETLPSLFLVDFTLPADEDGFTCVSYLALANTEKKRTRSRAQTIRKRLTCCL